MKYMLRARHTIWLSFVENLRWGTFKNKMTDR